MNDDLIRVNTGNVPTFDGDYQKFQLWWRKLRAYGYLAGFGDSIGEERDPNLPETYTTPLDLVVECKDCLRGRMKWQCPTSQWYLYKK